MSNPSSDMKSSPTSCTQLVDTGRVPLEFQIPINSSTNKPIIKPQILKDTTRNLGKKEPNSIVEQNAPKITNSCISEVESSLENLSLYKNTATPAQLELNSHEPAEKKVLDGDERQSLRPSSDRPASDRSGSQEDSADPRGVSTDGQQPVIVVSYRTVATEPFADQLQPLQVLVDDPDPRLLDALENPRDRLFVLKLEQEVVNFIVTASSESFDTPHLNSYHRMLTHKIAEFYRLTHVASPDSAECVKLMRGISTRIPSTRLMDIKIPTKTPSETPPPGSQSVKIMRRALSEKGSDAASDKSVGAKAMLDPQSGDCSKPFTREEREAAYQLARARIFGDFKESPPETPSPTKTPNERSQPKPPKEQDDNFQSRSQFFPVPHMYPTYEGQRNRAHILPPMPNHTQMSHGFNHHHNLNPNANAYIPGRPMQALERVYPLPIPPQQLQPQQMQTPFYQNLGYPSHLPQNSPFTPSQPNNYNHTFPPPAATTHTTNFPPVPPTIPNTHPSTFPSGINPRYSPAGPNYSPQPMNNFVRSASGYNRPPPDASNMNNFPIQSHQPSGTFSGMSGGWPVHDGKLLQNRSLEPGNNGLPGKNPGVYGLGGRH